MGGVAGLLILGLGATPALAIPEAEAIKKLEAVAVYVVVNAEGQPAFYQESPDQLVLPMFMTAERAQQARQTLEEGPDAEGIRIVSVPLNIAFERNEQLVQTIKEKDENKSLITPLVPARTDWKKAEEILLAEGVNQEEIAEKLQVPVFFSDPPISITPPGAEEAKIALFFNYSQLQQAKQNVPDFDGTDKVVDWRVAINWVIQDEEDNYFFLPTVDLIRTLQDQQADGGSSPDQTLSPVPPIKVLPDQ
ncbi:MAG: hypothetical protein TH68_04930 [Candidatus Synechococcus spongiarum 142]|uniref:Uncharacterized protein n=1 Tax=Candidatus Synechococcus spongiarum 142 TaxID=1608213 RepID=A0A6N3X8N8_9SYNE|nr:MAG: hypothetical protein TH68_04930 [Candidatus Synechococcus spongiarum 142]